MQDPVKLKNDILNQISKTKSNEVLEKIRISSLGKKGSISLLMKKLGEIDPKERKNVGQVLNQIQKEITYALDKQKEILDALALETKLKEEWVDISLSPRPENLGRIHPLSRTMDEVVAIFSEMGFKVAEGPDIETDYYNFTALNIPLEHPARQEHDTFYFPEDKEGKRKVLRTHTSPVQVRTMEKIKPPIRVIVPGRTYRSDHDATHSPMFHQCEGLVIGPDLNMSHLKGCLIDFCRAFFGVDNLPVRFRPSYFPFTEPSAEMDVAFTKKNNVIKIGEGDQWLEILGCGMVNPRVLENCNIDSNKYQGFAFGMGIERLSMLKYGITDMRGFFDTDFRWLNHYGFNPLDLTSSSGI